MLHYHFLLTCFDQYIINDVIKIIQQLFLDVHIIKIYPPTIEEWNKNNTLNKDLIRSINFNNIEFLESKVIFYRKRIFTYIESEYLLYSINYNILLTVKLKKYLDSHQLYYNKNLFKNDISYTIIPFYLIPQFNMKSRNHTL
jgi:hypothetical protein